jgi:hypothetical protein
MSQSAVAVAFLRGKAAEHRRSAQSIKSPQQAAELLHLATEYETKAADLQTRLELEKSNHAAREAQYTRGATDRM